MIEKNAASEITKKLSEDAVKPCVPFGAILNVFYLDAPRKKMKYKSLLEHCNLKVVTERKDSGLLANEVLASVQSEQNSLTPPKRLYFSIVLLGALSLMYTAGSAQKFEHERVTLPMALETLLFLHILTKSRFHGAHIDDIADLRVKVTLLVEHRAPQFQNASEVHQKIDFSALTTGVDKLVEAPIDTENFLRWLMDC